VTRIRHLSIQAHPQAECGGQAERTRPLLAHPIRSRRGPIVAGAPAAGFNEIITPPPCALEPPERTNVALPTAEAAPPKIM
jgi:hypothetical protein